MQQKSRRFSGNLSETSKSAESCAHYPETGALAHAGCVAREGGKIHIPLETDEALRLALKVKPTANMPRPGATKKAKKRAAPKKRGK